MDMEKRIKLELRNRKPSEVGQLALDNCRSRQGKIVGLTDEFLNLEVLSLVNTGIISLDGLPKLPKLQKLDLLGNRVRKLEALAEKTPDLQQLNLRHNNIKDLSALKPLKKLAMLKSVELLGCEVSMLQDYRKRVLEYLSQITFLDGYDAADKEAVNSGSELDEDEDGLSDQSEDDEDGAEENDGDSEVESEDGITGESDGLDDDDDDCIDDGDDDIDDDASDIDDDDDDIDDEDDAEEASPAKKRKRCDDDDDDDDDDN